MSAAGTSTGKVPGWISHDLGAGASAGGFGGGFNFIRFAKAFSSSQMTFLDDSAPILGDAYAAPCLQSQWRDTWGLTEA